MFSIDSVSGTMRKDVTRYLERIEQTAAALAAAQVPSPPDGKPLDYPGFRIIAEAGHAIYGTSSLVGADSLATCAKALEELAERGRHDQILAERHADRARKITEVLRAGAEEMRGMLSLEIDHRGEDAQWIALEWQERATELLRSPMTFSPIDSIKPDALLEGEIPLVIEAEAKAEPEDDIALRSFQFAAEGEREENAAEADAALVAAEAEPEFGFVDDGTEADEFSFEPVSDQKPQSRPADDDIHDELREIFQEEARESLVALQGHIEALFADANDFVAARALERLYHTLKGAAATVGLEEVSAAAGALQDRMQGVVEEGHAVTPELLSALVEETTGLLHTAGLPNVTLTIRKDGKPTSAPALATAEGRSVFVAEAREAFHEANGLIAKIEAAGPDATDAQSALGRLFHRLKGSSLVAGNDQISAEAARLEKVCDGGNATLAELAQGLARLAALSGVPGNHGDEAVEKRRPKSSPAQSESVQEETSSTFAMEARRIWQDASRLVGTLEASQTGGSKDAPRTLETLEELGRLFHRLKGSALVVGEDAVAKDAAKLQRACEGDTADGSAHALKDGLARIAAALGLDGSRSEGSTTTAHYAMAVPEPELWAAFSLECAELLEMLDSRILQLEGSDRPRERMEELLPTYHTLKGVVNTLDMVPTGNTLHRVEDWLLFPAMPAVATFLLQVQVEVRRNLKQAKKGSIEVSLPKIEAQIARVLSGRPIKATNVPNADDSALSKGSVRSGDSALSKGEHALARDFVRVGTDRLDHLMDLAGELVVSRSRLLSRVSALRTLQTELGRGGRRLIESVERFCEEHEFARLDGTTGAVRAPAVLALAAGAEYMSAALALAPSDGSSVGAANVAWGGFSDLELDRYEDVHVLARSLTELTSDFGEMYAQMSNGLSVLTDDSDAFGGIVSGIQSEITRSRMVPMEVLFTRLRLPVRDAAMREQKDVRVVTEGESVHLDKTIADALFQPMLHLVRNAVAHGLEKSRAAVHKPLDGTIKLVARQELGQVIVEVSDDGAGLNLQRLRAQGIAMGIISDEVQVDDPRVRDLIFTTGLSTEQSARAVAGRGLGCDIVKRAVERLNGSIRVESEPGRGTRFILTLPLTLAITQALLVRQGTQTFAVPLYFAERILDASDQELIESAGLRRVRLDGQINQVSDLGAFLGKPSTKTQRPILVLRSGAERIMLHVDAVVGQEEIVVKNLGTVLTGHPLFAGVTIRGSGEMALILDVPGLAEARQREALAEGRTPRALRPTPAVHALVPEEEKAPASEPRRKVARGHDSRDDAQRRLRVLFVDDSLSVRKVAEKALVSLNVDVTLAVDGVDALAKMREGHFDLVFTDLEMPRMHGFELIRELRFLAAYQDLPIVVVTSRSGQKHQEQARALGATEYLTKPFTPRTLEAALSKWGRIRAMEDA